MKVEVSRDDIEEAACRMVERLVNKHALPPGTYNKYGVEILHKPEDPAMFCLHFVTYDALEVELPYDLIELQRRGKRYLDERMELLRDQLGKARAVRQEENRITIVSREPYEPKPVAEAVDKVLH